MVPLSDAVGFFTNVPSQTVITPRFSQFTKEDQRAAEGRSREGLTLDQEEDDAIVPANDGNGVRPWRLGLVSGSQSCPAQTYTRYVWGEPVSSQVVTTSSTVLAPTTVVMTPIIKPSRGAATSPPGTSFNPGGREFSPGGDRNPCGSIGSSHRATVHPIANADSGADDPHRQWSRDGIWFRSTEQGCVPGVVPGTQLLLFVFPAEARGETRITLVA